MNRSFSIILAVLLIGTMACSAVFACELMGFSFNEKVPANHTFEAFKLRGARCPDGWGVAFYPDKSVQLFKEPESASESTLAGFLVQYKGFKTEILIAHLRRARVGGAIHENTHPFQRELDGGEYVLAHNGVLKGFNEKLELGRIKPLGINDTEFLLCYILGEIEKKKIKEWDGPAFEWMRELFLRINDIGTLNVLFSDGEYLFAYHDKDGFSSLHSIERKKPYSNIHYNGIHKKTDLGTVYPESASGIIVSTKPLTDEKWTPFTPGQLVVLKKGKPVYDSEKDLTNWK